MILEANKNEFCASIIKHYLDNSKPNIFLLNLNFHIIIRLSK